MDYTLFRISYGEGKSAFGSMQQDCDDVIFFLCRFQAQTLPQCLPSTSKKSEQEQFNEDLCLIFVSNLIDDLFGERIKSLQKKLETIFPY